MAVVHVVTTIMKPISATGSVLDKSKATIAEMSRATSEVRVDVVGFPTIADYLAAEYADGFAFKHMDQTYIITDK